MRHLKVLTSAVLLSVATLASAQSPAPPAEKAPLTPSDAAQWRAYAMQLEGDLKQKSRDLAGAQAQLALYQEAIEKLQKHIADQAKGQPAPKP